MAEDNKVQAGFRLAPATVETIERLSKAESVGKGELVDLAVAHYDKEPIVTETPELPDDASVVILIPRDQKMLEEAFGNLIATCAPYIHSDHIWKAFICARHDFQKDLPEFKSAERMRADFDARRAAATRPLAYDRKGPSLK